VTMAGGGGAELTVVVLWALHLLFLLFLGPGKTCQLKFSSFLLNAQLSLG
jgi:hypothetical protein